MIHSFLLIGQSNMAGRGFFQEVEPLPNHHQFVMRNGRWQPLFTPINPDRPFAGVSLGESFAFEYTQNYPDRQIGLIPCADGGTDIKQWVRGTLLYEHAVMMAKLAMRTSSLDGILWHQGESDCSPDKYPCYESLLTEMIHDMRSDLNLPEIPFIVGALGNYLPDCTYDKTLINYTHINAALQKIANTIPHVLCVSANGLTSNPDYLHFNAKSLREFGRRYYIAYQSIAAESRFYGGRVASK